MKELTVIKSKLQNRKQYYESNNDNYIEEFLFDV